LKIPNSSITKAGENFDILAGESGFYIWLQAKQTFTMTCINFAAGVNSK
jgi:hypothetical protein